MRFMEDGNALHVFWFNVSACCVCVVFEVILVFSVDLNI